MFTLSIALKLLVDVRCINKNPFFGSSSALICFQFPLRSRSHSRPRSHICRYSFQKSSLATSVSKDALDITLWHQPNDLLQLGASFIFNKRTSKPVGSLCYQLEMKDAIIKGMIDSDWSIGCTYNRYETNWIGRLCRELCGESLFH